MATTRTTASDDAAAHAQHGYVSDKARYLARLKRIEGQPAASTGWSRRRSTA